MTAVGEKLIAAALASSQEVGISDLGHEPELKPRFLVEVESPERTVAALRDILAGANVMFERGVPVRLAFDQLKHGVIVEAMTPDMVILQTHMICRPYKKKRLKDGTVIEVDASLPIPIARMYLGWRDWRLRGLGGLGGLARMVGCGRMGFRHGNNSSRLVLLCSGRDGNDAPATSSKDSGCKG